jgi:hypothetical protein
MLLKHVEGARRVRVSHVVHIPQAAGFNCHVRRVAAQPSWRRCVEPAASCRHEGNAVRLNGSTVAGAVASGWHVDPEHRHMDDVLAYGPLDNRRRGRRG